MATMVKEKRREKKKSKEKSVSKSVIPEVLCKEDSPIPSASELVETTLAVETPRVETLSHQDEVRIGEKAEVNLTIENSAAESSSQKIRCDDTESITQTQLMTQNTTLDSDLKTAISLSESCTHMPLQTPLEEKVIEDTENKLKDNIVESGQECLESKVVEEEVAPSAPMLEFDEVPVDTQREDSRIIFEVPKLLSMRLEEAVKAYHGLEMAEIMAISKKEEAAVEAGPQSGPEHALVDLLSTFKRSLIAVERERTQLATGFMEEEKSRTALWKIEKRDICHYETCPPCARTVWFKGSYEVAKLQQEKLPAARLRLEALLRDLQDSYCHHQHAALLAHCQIEEFISETIQGSVSGIREALSLILQALKMSDSAPAALSSALQRWAVALAAAMLTGPDFMRQLLFLIHHLFRQTISVRWAARVIPFSVGDHISAARTIALLDVLLTRPGVDFAVECVEDKEEDWEEVDKDGGGGAVSDGTLRERDMLALLRAFPLRDLLARILLFTNSDIREARDWGWGEARGGRDVCRACFGCRALLHVLTRAAAAHAHYTRVRRVLHDYAASAARALAALHEHARSFYAKDMELKVQAELEAVFTSCLGLLAPADFHRLPAGLLSSHAAKDYCIAHIVNLHETASIRVESLSTEVAPLACEARVRVVAQAAIDRLQDFELARIVLEFLFTTGIRRKSGSCAGPCRLAARECLPRLLAAHAHLYAPALLLVADTSTVEKLKACSVDCLRVSGWRPSAEEVGAVAEDWARRCPHLLPPLLLQLDCTPHTGVSLDSQLTIGWWLCEQVPSQSPSEVEEWCWSVVCRLRVHRTCWGLPPDAPPVAPPVVPLVAPPPSPPRSLLAKAFALMATDWGHSVPLICSEGVEALCALATARPALALHCLAPAMLLLAHARDSIALTPRFADFFAIILNAGPSLVQRALGRGGVSGADLLLKLVLEQLAEDQCGGVPRATLARAWITALWRPALTHSVSLLDSALATQKHQLLDEHTAQLARAQDEETLQQLSLAMKLSAQAPLVCCSALRAWHTQRALLPGLYPRLLDALHSQRLSGQRIHVANALKLIGATMNAEELVIYRCAVAVLAAPSAHPAHLQLWRLLLHLYLQRPPSYMANTTPPVGPLFFSGLIKSRVLGQLKRRLQECIKYHREQASVISEPAKATPRQTPARVTQSESRTTDNRLLSMLTINDLTGESSELSDSDVSDGGDEQRSGTAFEVVTGTGSEEVQDKANLKAYHVGAERMLQAYAQWLEEGERTGVPEHYADVGRFITEAGQAAAWREHGRSRRPPPPPPEPLPLPPLRPPRRPAAPRTPFETATATLLAIRDKRKRRSRSLAIKSPVDDVNFKDARSLLALVDKHLKDIEALAKEWCSEVCRISSLDGALWPLVTELRVPRPLPVMRVACANGCAPLQYAPPQREWCISLSAVRGIQENRASALSCIRRLARPRPHAARTAAALLTIARRVPGGAGPRAACERAWRAAACATGRTAPHATALTTFFETLAERWLSSDGVVCAELISRWCSGSLSSLQQDLCSALVAPGRLSPHHVPALHAALLRSALPPHVAFSCLSKFEMGRWAAVVDSAARREMLASLRDAVIRWGRMAEEDPECQILVELLGVQSACVCAAAELGAHVRACAQLTATGACPPAHAAHVLRAARHVANDVPFDQLGHLLRELGVIFWEARTGLKGKRHGRYAEYAPHVAALLRTLHQAFVAAAVQQSYAPERVATYAWSSLVESWGAWVTPHSAPPLLPSVTEEEAYTPMLQQFHQCIKQVIIDCPGSDEHLLNQLFDWTMQTYLAVDGASPTQEGRVQRSALLAELSAAPWTSSQWLGENTLNTLLQTCQRGDGEACAWAARCCGGQRVRTWLRGASDALLPARLALLLHLLTCTPLHLDHQTLEEATTLPWQRLPEAALEEALERFFMEHHSNAVPYHELPQFKVILAASELHWCPVSGISSAASSRCKRGRLVATWLRAGSGPPAAPHVPAYQARLLHLIDSLTPHLESSEGEIEDLISRAMIILCIEPAAAAALPVWVSWVGSTGRRGRGACVRGVASLTAFEYFAPLADAAVAAYIQSNDCEGWSWVRDAWAACPWSSAAPLCARARLHAAYATLLAHEHSPRDLTTALLALLAASIHFVENELIVAVWVCAAGRVAGGEGRDAAAALLRRWAGPARRSLLSVVTLQPDTARPTPKLRLLCQMALCLLSPGDEECARALAASGAALSLPPAALVPPRAACPRHLPRLALRLYQHDPYFAEELRLAPEDPV